MSTLSMVSLRTRLSRVSLLPLVPLRAGVDGVTIDDVGRTYLRFVAMVERWGDVQRSTGGQAQIT